MLKKLVLLTAAIVNFKSCADDICPDCRKPFVHSNQQEQILVLPLKDMHVTVDASFNEYLLKAKPPKFDTVYNALFNTNFIFEYLRGDYDFNQLLSNLAKVHHNYIFKIAPQDFFVRSLPTTSITKKNLMQNWPSFRLSYAQSALIMDETDSLLGDKEVIQNFFNAQQSTLVIIYRGHLLATCKCINWIGIIMQKDNSGITAYIIDAHVKKVHADFYKRIIDKILKLLATAF